MSEWIYPKVFYCELPKEGSTVEFYGLRFDGWANGVYVDGKFKDFESQQSYLPKEIKQWRYDNT